MSDRDLCERILANDEGATPGPWDYVLRITSSVKHDSYLVVPPVSERGPTIRPHKACRDLYRVAACGRSVTPGGSFICNRDTELIASYRTDAPECARRLALALDVVEAAREIASENYGKGHHLTCGAEYRGLVDALAAFDAERSTT